MRIDISSNQYQKSRVKAEDHAEPAYTTTLKILSVTDSIEEWYDQWIESGGMHRKTYHGILCVRNTPTVLPDKDIQRQLVSYSTDVKTTQQSLSSSLVRVDAEEDLYGDFSGQTDVDFESERTVVGTMVLRQHFKLLTLALLRPFEGFFKPVASSEMSITSTFNSVFSFSNPASDNVLVQSTSKAAGASSMILYSNPLHILGKSNVYQSVEEFAAKEGNESNLPRPIRKAAWKPILLAFGKSDTFTAWCRWRREHECLQLLLLSSQACVNLSARELMAAYAVEQGVDELSTLHLRKLLVRIKLTIKAMYIINQRLFSVSDKLLDDTAIDISHLASKQSCIDDGDMHRSVDAVSSPVLTSTKTCSIGPGDLIFLMKRHFTAISNYIQSKYVNHAQQARPLDRHLHEEAHQNTVISEVARNQSTDNTITMAASSEYAVMGSDGPIGARLSSSHSWGLRSSALEDSDDDCGGDESD